MFLSSFQGQQPKAIPEMARLGDNCSTRCITFILGVIFLLALSNFVASQTIVKNLPGFPGELPFLLETGYVGVGKQEEVQLFYYFIEAEGAPPNDPNVPLLLWVSGGLGCSALYGLIYEIGPLAFDYEKSAQEHKPVLVLNDYSWTKVANIIFLDAPVGTGFSYATTSEAYNTSDTKTIADIYEFLRKWLLAHPKFKTGPVYIAGDSYSGIIVPPLVEKIYNDNEAGVTPGINIRGYVLGNPFTNFEYDYNSRVKFAHRMALLSDELYEATKLDCQGEYAHPNKSNSACIQLIEIVNQCLLDIYKPMILEPSCHRTSSDPNTLDWDPYPFGGSFSDPLFTEANPIGPWCRDYDYLFVNVWANDKAVQEALHVRNGTIQEWQRCNKSLSYVRDIKTSLAYHRNLTTKNIQVLVYSGDHDLVIPHVGTEQWIGSLNLTISGSYDEWRPWLIDSQVAGYTVQYTEGLYYFTYATVKGGGHTAPEYRPRECYEMIGRWLGHYYL